MNGVVSYFLVFFGLVLGIQSPVTVTAPAPTDLPRAEAAISQPSITENTPVDGDIRDAGVLAQCLTDGGAKLYGAYWCPHCQDQKKMFGDAVNMVDFVECDAGGPQGNPQACIDAGIEAYPTWQMPGKEDQVGTLSLDKLAVWSGCTY